MARTLSRRIAVTLLPAGLLPGLGRAAGAAPLSSPAGRVILTISGKIRLLNTADAARFDRDMLEALGTTSFSTQTPWYDDPVTFEGVRMDRLMEAVGAYGTTVTATALNDYMTELPVSDFARFGPILALKRNGAYMPVRDKGPLWIVYPFDSDNLLGRPPYTSRSAWQVKQLVVK